MKFPGAQKCAERQHKRKAAATAVEKTASLEKKLKEAHEKLKEAQEKLVNYAEIAHIKVCLDPPPPFPPPAHTHTHTHTHTRARTFPCPPRLTSPPSLPSRQQETDYAPEAPVWVHHNGNMMMEGLFDMTTGWYPAQVIAKPAKEAGQPQFYDIYYVDVERNCVTGDYAKDFEAYLMRPRVGTPVAYSHTRFGVEIDGNVGEADDA